MSNLICIDIEATDRVPSNACPLTLCAIKLDKSLAELDRIVIKMRPERWDLFADQAVQIHGITKEEAMTFPPVCDGLSHLLAWSGEDNYFVAHANRRSRYTYDYSVMLYAFLDSGIKGGPTHFDFYKAFPRNKIVSTHTLVKSTLSLSSYSLDSICQHYGIDLRHHDAESDANACAEILKRVSRTHNIYQIMEQERDGTISQVRKDRKGKKSGANDQPGATSESPWDSWSEPIEY